MALDPIDDLPHVGIVAHPWADCRRSPFYVTRWGERSDEGDIQRYFDAVDEWLAEVDSPWVTIMDFSGFEPRSSTAAQRKVFADRALATRELARHHCVGIAAIAPSTLVTGIVNSVMWVVHTPFPVRVFTDTRDAEIWLLRKLRDAAKDTTIRPPPLLR